MQKYCDDEEHHNLQSCTMVKCPAVLICKCYTTDLEWSFYTETMINYVGTFCFFFINHELRYW